MLHRFALSFILVAFGSASVNAQTLKWSELYALAPSYDAFVNGYDVGDLDGDGLPDVALAVDVPPIASADWTPLHLQHNLGGHFEEWPTPLPSQTPVALTSHADVVLLDRGQDGDLDLFIVRRGQVLSHLVWTNDGSGTFTEEPDGLVPPFADAPITAAAGDLSGDGRTDVLIGSRSGRNRTYFDLDTHFVPGFPGATGLVFERTYEVVLGDLDLDGDLDAVLSGLEQTSVNSAMGGAVFLNDGLASFTKTSFIHDTYVMDLVDVENDGDLDAVTWSDIRLNNGNASFTIGHVFPHQTTVDEVTCGDLDGNGAPELVFVKDGSDGCRLLYENDGAGSFVDISARLDADSNSFAHARLVDLDADNDVDLIFPGPDRLEIWRGSGTGEFAGPPGLNRLSGVGPELALADVNGDGLLDIYAGGPGHHTLALGTGNGRFLSGAAGLPPAVDAELVDAELGDVDGDGAVDLVQAFRVAAPQVFPNLGAGTFGSAVTQPSLPAETDGFELGDLDGDGDLDALLGGEFGLRMLEGVGTSVFTVESVGLDFPTRVTDLELADIDGDGDLDAFLAGLDNRVVTNDGTGSFALGADLSNFAFPGSTSSDFVTTGDIDDDGAIDVIIGARSTTHVFTNQGGGAFSAGFVHTSLFALQDIGLLDLNNDGTLEAFLGWQRENKVALRVGNGYGIGPSPETDFHSAIAIETGDVDRDGDDDLILVEAFSGNDSQYRLRVATNLYRQLSSLPPALLGGPVTLQVEGAANEPWILAWALTDAEIPLSPNGVLRLPLLGLQLAHVGFVDATGSGSHTIIAPAFAGLAGLDVYWQALIGAGIPGFTNLEVTTLTAD